MKSSSTRVLSRPEIQVILRLSAPKSSRRSRKALTSNEARPDVHEERQKEAFAALTKFANDAQLTAASLTPSALSKSDRRWFDFENKTYKRIEVGEAPDHRLCAQREGTVGRRLEDDPLLVCRHTTSELHSYPTDLWDRLKSRIRFIHCAGGGSSF